MMFGGYLEDGTPTAETWLLRDQTWQRLSTLASPPPRGAAGLAWDGREILLFGGSASLGSDQVMRDTWTFDGVSWTRVATPVAPSARSVGPAMVGDPRGVVLYGGYSPSDPGSQGGNLGDTWRWHTSSRSWARVAAGGPGPRRTHLVWEPRAGHVLLVGGAAEVLHDDVWALSDGDRWHKRVSDCLQNSCYVNVNGGGVAWDGAEVLAFDGSHRSTWVLGERGWARARVASEPPARLGAAMTWDETGDRAVLFAGSKVYGDGYLGDTWWAKGPFAVASTSHPRPTPLSSSSPSTHGRVSPGPSPARHVQASSTPRPGATISTPAATGRVPLSPRAKARVAPPRGVEAEAGLRTAPVLISLLLLALVSIAQVLAHARRLSA